jgi:hypothetical protein
MLVALAFNRPLVMARRNAFHCDVSERLVMAMADAMVASGLAKAGYSYINLVRSSLSCLFLCAGGIGV